MPLRPLSPTGVSQKTADLYALSDNNLFAEAEAARTNFPLWMSANFILDPSQQGYINSMDNVFVTTIASRIALALRNRLQINLFCPDPLPPPIISKLVRMEDTIMAQYSQATGATFTGEVNIYIEYP